MVKYTLNNFLKTKSLFDIVIGVKDTKIKINAKNLILYVFETTHEKKHVIKNNI
jgi:hypothetical protein